MKTIIAHRGACGYLPEHTLPAYAMAHAMGADYLEPDLVMTRDGVLIILHDIDLAATTDVAQRFPERRNARGHWCPADFDFAEIRQLQARERLEGRFRRDSRGFQVPAFEELLQLLSELNRLTGRRVGVYPETKSPAFHRRRGLPMEPPLLELLARYGYSSREDRVCIQSFDPDNLRQIREELGSELMLVQLLSRTPSATRLDEIARYGDGIGPDKRLIENRRRQPVRDNALVREAHARGLLVHPFTFRADQLTAGDSGLEDELRRFYFDYGVDGLFCDHPDIACRIAHTEDHGETSS